MSASDSKPGRPWPALDPALGPQLQRLFDQGASISEACRQLGLSRYHAQQLIVRQQLDTSRCVVSRSSHDRSRQPQQRLDDIRAQIAQGSSYAKIGKQLGLSRERIRQLVDRHELGVKGEQPEK